MAAKMNPAVRMSQSLCFIGGQDSVRVAGRSGCPLVWGSALPSGRLLGGIWQNGNFGGKLAVARIHISGESACKSDKGESEEESKMEKRNKESGTRFHE